MININFDIAIIRTNSITYDSRVIKIISSLSKKYKIIVLGWDREMSHKSYEIVNNRVHIKRLKLRAPFGKISLIIYYPFFWAWVFANLLLYRTSVIHACDLDSLIPCYSFKIISSSKLVFDSFDRYAMTYIPPKYFLIYKFVNYLENLIAFNVDALITVSEERLLTFSKYKPKNTAVIMNCPIEITKKINKNEFLDNQLHDHFSIVYAGSLTRTRGLLLIEKAIRKCQNVHVYLAGRIVDDIIHEILNNSYIHYIGLLNYEDSLQLQSRADVIPILYDPSVPINLVANPSKLFEAMMLGVPVITNVCREIVTQVECGLVVDYDFKSVKDAIYHLKNNPSLGKEMGKNGRLAFEKYYNWRLMEERLMRLYNYILLRS